MSWLPFRRRGLAGLFGTTLLPDHATAQQAPAGARALAAAVNGITARMLAGLAEQGSGPALLASPLSLADACALLVPAATDEAERVLRAAFALPGRGPAMGPFAELDAALAGAAPLRRATALWLRPGVETLPAYAEAIRPLRTLSRRAVAFTDPNAVSRINAWVAEATEGRIREILRGPLPPRTNAVITSALHFRAQWAEAFPASATRPGAFRRPGGAALQVPMMSRVMRGAYAQQEAVHAVRLPYTDRGFEFLALAPKPDAPADAAIALLRSGRAAEVLAALPFAEAEIVTTLPRCQAEASIDLMRALQGTALGPAFRPQAEYQGMLGVPTEIAEAVQKAVLLINEEGTEAAASTAIVMQSRGVRLPERPVFGADAPFLAAVRHRASGVLVVLALIAAPQPIA